MSQPAPSSLVLTAEQQRLVHDTWNGYVSGQVPLHPIYRGRNAILHATIDAIRAVLRGELGRDVPKAQIREALARLGLRERPVTAGRFGPTESH